MTDRRWIPEGGIQKHRDKIHKESKVADTKNLPYTLSRPPIRKSFEYFECEECGRQFDASKNTIMVACPDCKKLTKARKVNE